MADLFALDRIYSDITFRNDDYIAPEKAKASHGGCTAGALVLACSEGALCGE